MTTFSIRYEQPESDKIKQLIPKKASEAARCFGEAIDNRKKQHHEAHGNKYSWFQSSWLLADYLAEEYPEELDPGRIIGQYLNLLFPEKELSFGLENINEIPPKKILHGSLIHDIVTQMGFACIESADVSLRTKTALQVALTGFLNPRDEFLLPEGMFLVDIVDAAISAPEGFFSSWALGSWLASIDEDFYGPQVTKECLKKVLSRCTIVGANNISNSVKYEYLDLNLIVALIYKIYTENSVEYDDEINELITQFFDDYTKIRRQTFCGVSPINRYSIHDFFMFYFYFKPYNIQVSDLSVLDLSVLLSCGQFDFKETYLLPESKDPEHILIEFNEIQKVYFLLFQKCTEEGLTELANALLSLYLFGRCIFCNGRFATGNDLEGVISKGLSLPGNRTLKHTLSLIVAESERSFSNDAMAMLSRRFLKQFIPQQAQLHVLSGKEHEPSKRPAASEIEVQTVLSDDLGKDRWNKLSRESQEHLVSAEILWRKTYAEFGFGIKDCSGLITNYFKVIEKELVDRLSVFYHSSSYRIYVETVDKQALPKKPTSGWLLKVLTKFESLSPELQQMIDATSIKLQHEEKLISKLRSLIEKHRNRAAHDGTYDMVKITEFRKLFYQDRILHRFIDAIA